MDPGNFWCFVRPLESGCLRSWANVTSGCSCLLSAYSQGLKADLSPTVSPDGNLTFQFRVRTEANVCTKDLPSWWSVFLLMFFPPLLTFQVPVDILRSNALCSEPHTFQVFVFIHIYYTYAHLVSSTQISVGHLLCSTWSVQPLF